MEVVKQIVKQASKRKQRNAGTIPILKLKLGSPSRTRTYNLAVNSRPHLRTI